MASDVVQAKYDDLERVATRFAQQAEMQERLLREVGQKFERLRGGSWQGKGIDAFSREMDGEVRPAVQRLHTALTKSQYEVGQIILMFREAETLAASLFRVNGDSTPISEGALVNMEEPATDSSPIIKDGFANRIHRTIPTPTNMAEYYKLLEDTPIDHPIQVIPLPNGEYLVTVQGTKGMPQDISAWSGSSNTWTTNLSSGLGFESVYTQRIKEVIKQAIPPGATIHLVGHSQGGHASQIVGNAMAANGEYTVGSVTTFGAYYAVAPDSRIGQSHAYLNVTDALNYVDILRSTATITTLPLPLTILVENGKNRETILYDFSELNPAAAHLNYEFNDELQHTSLPFDIPPGGSLQAIGYDAPEEDFIVKGARPVIKGLDEAATAVGDLLDVVL